MECEEIDFSFFCDQEYNLWLLFSHTWRAMFKARERELSGYGITPDQAELLLAVQALGGCTTPAAISRSTLREPHTISGLIDRMNAKGLITKNQDEKRRNVVRVCLTPKGEEAYQNSTRRQVISEIIAGLSIEERR